MRKKTIKWQSDNPVQITVKDTGGCKIFGKVDFSDTCPAVWFQGQNYLYPWEIDAFIKGLRKAQDYINQESAVEKKRKEGHQKYRGISFEIWLFFHKIKCKFWNWRLPKDLNLKLNDWLDIDRKKDKSLSAKDFKFWLYLRKVNE